MTATAPPAVARLLAVLLVLQLAGCQPLSTSVWSYYTKLEGAFFLAGDLRSAGTASMDEECATLCLQLGVTKCQAWAWCAAFFLDGCEVLNYANATADASTTLLRPGTCLLSGREAADQLSASVMFGDSVLWVSGNYDPSLLDAPGVGGSPTPQPQANPPSLTSTPGPEAETPPLTGSPDAASEAPIFQRWAYIPNTFHAGPNIVGASSALSPAECAEMCEAVQPCKWWAYCSAGTAGCNAPLFLNSGLEDVSFELLSAGTCILSHDAQDGGAYGGTIQGRLAYRYQEGSAVPWSSGYLNASSTSPPNSSPEPGGSPSLPDGGGGNGGAGGACSMPGLTDCGGFTGCRDLSIDVENCGACGNRCSFGETCNFGSCDIRCGGLDPNLKYCGTGGCVDLLSDAMHCGQCAWACLPGQFCFVGQCQSL